MTTVVYEFLLNATSFLRVEFEKQGGRILRFVIQLECLIDDEWYPVLRYDTTHEFAHCDVLHPNEDTRKIDLNLADYNEAFAFARQDLADRWQFYCERYSQWLNEK